MKIETREVYKCDHCRKLYQIKSSAERHEKLCSKNPKNQRPCFTCIHLDKREATTSGYYFNGNEWERPVKVLFCTAKDIFIHTPQNEIKGNAFDLGDELNEPMPVECERFKHFSDINSSKIIGNDIDDFFNL
jgi:hypothetical protein